MAKSYNVDVNYKFSGNSDSFHTADVYQQLCAHRDIHTFAPGGEGFWTAEVFIPYGAISYAVTNITDGESVTPEDEFCNAEEV